MSNFRQDVDANITEPHSAHKPRKNEQIVSTLELPGPTEQQGVGITIDMGDVNMQLQDDGNDLIEGSEHSNPSRKSSSIF